jgi:hypothetical protein
MGGCFQRRLMGGCFQRRLFPAAAVENLSKSFTNITH